MTDEPTGLTVQGRVVKPGQQLFKQGAKVTSAFKVEDGEVELLRGETRVAVCAKGDFLGAAATILEVEQPFTAQGVARPLSYMSEYRGHDVTHAFSVNAELATDLYRSLCLELERIEQHRGAAGGGTESAMAAFAAALTEPEIGLRIGRVRTLQKEKAREILAAVEKL